MMTLLFLTLAGVLAGAFGEMPSRLLKRAATATFSVLASDLPELPPPSLGPWLLNLLYALAVLFFLLGGIEKIKRVFGGKDPEKRTKEQGATVSALKQLDLDTTTKFDGFSRSLAAIERKADERGEAIRADIKELDRTSEERVTNVHNRVNEVSKAVGKIEGSVGEISKAISDMRHGRRP
jgi:hypothetical protein